MKTIIAGSRGASYQETMDAIFKCPWPITSVVSGMARGPDTFGREWAIANDIPVHCYPADWVKWGKWAGYERNARMAKDSEALIAVWDGTSKGTKHMIEGANEYGLKVYIYSINELRGL